ncbi:ryncolin-4 [Stomoxys calcitrans]|uniref:ryncolin-4 n=1 Tax=Stomoxys calcitrans TaxID=35570 RepID=UPI0027E2717F|nr:ryncolin-4 [Stomoxys calcitrans]
MHIIPLILILCVGLSFGADPTTHSPNLGADDKNVIMKELFETINPILKEIRKRIDDLTFRLDEQDSLIRSLEAKVSRFDPLAKQSEVPRVRIKQMIEDLEAFNRLDPLTKQQKLLLSDIETNEWKTILRRQDGSVNFYRNWADYKSGFGNPDGEFFIGLEVLHNLTSNGLPQELLVVMQEFDNTERQAKYDLFQVGNETEKYAILQLGEYSGNAEFNAMLYIKGAKFSTFDQDNDTDDTYDCAKNRKSGWWFMDCSYCNLTGPFRKTADTSGEGFLKWYWKNLKFAEMKIRAKK